MKCFYCGERLTLEPGKGYLHLDGELYKTVVGEDGVQGDDHCAFSIPDDAPTYKEWGVDGVWADLAQEVYDEEITRGMSSKIATFIADGVVHSPEYRAAWLAEREERQRERKEQEEGLDVCTCGTGCSECGGVPVRYS